MTVPHEAVQSAVQFGDAPDPEPMHAEVRRRAGSVANAPTGAPALHSAGEVAEVTESEFAAGYVAAAERAATAFRKITAGHSLLHAQPPSLAQIHERHRQSASRYTAGAAHWPRRAWGWLHTTLAGFFYSLLWAVFSPAGIAIIAIAVVVFWFWS